MRELGGAGLVGVGDGGGDGDERWGREERRGEVRLVGFFNLAVFAMLLGGISEGWILYAVVVVVAVSVSFAKSFLEISNESNPANDESDWLARYCSKVYQSAS